MFFFTGQHLICKNVQAPGLLVMLPVPAVCAVTSVREGRGILSVDKHVALSAAVTSWNGSWHEATHLAKNKRWRYSAEHGNIQGENFSLSKSFFLCQVFPCRGTDIRLFTFLPISTYKCSSWPILCHLGIVGVLISSINSFECLIWLKSCPLFSVSLFMCRTLVVISKFCAA